MKKIYTILAMASTMLATTLGFTSCEQDDDLNNLSNTDTKSRVLTTNDTTYAVTPFDFGAEGPEVYNPNIPKLDLGFKQGKLKLSDNLSLGPADLALLLLKEGAKQAAGGAGTAAFTEIVSFLTGDNSSEVKAGLDQINSHLDEITKMVESISKQVDDIAVANRMQERLDHFTPLDCYSCDKFRKIINAGGDTDKIKALVEKWGESYTDGSATYLSTIAYFDFLTSRFNVGERTMPQIYDYWVFNTTAWEHNGYELRENLRLSDISLAITSFFMSRMYHSLKGYDTQKLDDSFLAFCDLYEKTLVKHHDDYRICQIKDAHFIFRKNMITRDFATHSWFPEGKSWTCDNDFMYGEPGLSYTTAMDRTMSLAEAQAIYNFYNTDNSSPLTFAEILKKEGFNYNLDPNMRHIMPLTNGVTHVWDGDEVAYRYYMDFNEAVHANGTQFRQQNFRVTMLYITTSLRKSYYYLTDVIFFRPDMVKRYSDMYPEI